MQRGRAVAADDVLALPRVLVSQSTHWGHFLAKIITTYEDRHR